MSAHLLTFSPVRGIPKVEHFTSKQQLLDFYNGHPQGFIISTPAELRAAYEQYQGNGWVTQILDLIDPKGLDNGTAEQTAA